MRFTLIIIHFLFCLKERREYYYDNVWKETIKFLFIIKSFIAHCLTANGRYFKTISGIC